ncbi:MAG: exodeoxyribonuclease VII large subunit [Treponema sp.]|jgi:exodeoxyribonuclease VII large subunit|nr:exodeoxyribonuclease VII large subunit [Treponema sp.]
MREFTVSELTSLIKNNLENAFPEIVVQGEASNCRPSSTGHLYFTLKDGGACISAVMFRNRYRSLSFDPKDGMLLRATGALSVYPLRGAYQIVCEEIEKCGAGDILALLEQRKRTLAGEGLFDDARKQRLPRFPETVGVVSSPTGAALRDILNILNRRAASVNVVILPCPVQGSEAAAIIARRIEQANFWNLADVLIVGRGGGSLEDLLPFSEEIVVRAVAGSRIPVVSAVGHEIDWALSDYAADLRAPTPSAAAELVSADCGAALTVIHGIMDGMYQSMTMRLDKTRLLVKPFSAEDMEYRFRAILEPRLARFDDAKDALIISLQNRIIDMRRKLELERRTLEAADPNSVLRRGFAVVTAADTGKFVRNASYAKKGDRLNIRFMDGQVKAVVE